MRLLLNLTCAALITVSTQTLASTFDPGVIDSDTSLNYSADNFGWMLSDQFISRNLNVGQAGDREALKILAGLLRTKDPRAPTALQNYITRYPNDPAAYDLAGTDLLRSKEYETAAQAFAKAAKLDPEATWTRAKLGAALILGGQPNAGLAMMQIVVKTEPDNPLALRYLSWDAMRRNAAGLAIIHAERALNAFGLPEGQLNSAHLDLAQLYHRTGQHDRLLAFLNPFVTNEELEAPRTISFQAFGLYFESALRARKAEQARFAFDTLKTLSDPGRPEIAISEARLLKLEGNFDAAIEILTRLRTSNPDIAQALVPDLAIAEAGRGDTDTAVRRLVELAGVRGPGEDLPLLREAIAMYFSKDRGEEAVAMVRARADQDPRRTDLRHLLTETLLRAERTEEALELARAVATESEGNALANYTAGIAAAAAGEKEEAISYLEASLNVDPGSERTWLTLLGTSHGHDTYGHGGEASHEEVHKLLRRAIEAIPQSPNLRYELGLLTLSEGRPEDAIKIFDGALEHSPAHLPSLTLGALARVDAGVELDLAERQIQIAMALKNDDAVLQDIQGWLYLARDQKEEAVAALKAALESDPEDATIQYHLAVAYDRMDQDEKALDLYLTALTGDLYAHYETRSRTALTELSPTKMIMARVNRIDADGVHEEVGEIMFHSMGGGVHISGNVSGILPGENGAHIHMRPTCAPGEGPNGSVAGGLAGAHFGHHDHGKMAKPMADEMTMEAPKEDATMVMADGTVMDHSQMSAEDMAGMKPRGDLPALVADADGNASFDIMKMDLTLDEIRGRSIMFHAGPDGDDGSSGPKVACAVLP